MKHLWQALRSRCDMPSLVLALLCALIAGCTNIENSIYQGHKCFFVFDATLHPAPCQLTLALGNSGHFLTVSTTMKNGLRHIKTVRNYDLATEDIPITTQREANTACLLGANNAVIVGRSSYSGLFVAYEGQCANCLRDYGGINYPLTWTKNGQHLYCARCQRSYDVNNGVVASGEGGRQLYTYNIDFDGAVLRVWN